MLKLFPIILLLFLLSLPGAHAQNDAHSRQDSLRGSITPERAWWDLVFYNLQITVDPDRKFIRGNNEVRYRVLNQGKILQIDLQPPLQITKIVQDGKPLKFRTEGNAHFITLKKKQLAGAINSLTIEYEGNPIEAKRAPWDGGFSWKKDKNGNHFVATSCQGLGASSWWPNKDHMYDEVDSMAIAITGPKNLVGVGNGRLKQVIENEATNTYQWYVNNPINNYGVNVNLADYVHFGEQFSGEKGTLDMDYYVLSYNLEKAREQFIQAPMTIRAFEHWFGPYPFYEDSFKLVEVPYLGMEHQSSVTYGNQYLNGYLGNDLSGTGMGLLFDFIIVHETGHEWFANNITYRDIADMWIHEGFTAYSENLYLDYHFGTQAAEQYVIGTRRNIRNDKPIIGPYGVNKRGSGDMYYKGANILHTLRQLIEDDTLWRDILRGLNREFYHQTVTTEQVEDYISAQTGKDLSAFFNQYLRTAMVPVLEYRLTGDTLEYRYTEVVEGFDMPLRIFIGEAEKWLFPNSSWKSEVIGKKAIPEFDPNFYVITKKVK